MWDKVLEGYGSFHPRLICKSSTYVTWKTVSLQNRNCFEKCLQKGMIIDCLWEVTI